MLKAYSYSESEHLNISVHDRSFFEREKLLAMEFTDKYPGELSALLCPLCGSNSLEPFSTIARVRYARCKACWSLFATANRVVINDYRNYPPLKQLRESDAYQDMARKKRAGIWNEFAFWLQYRALRYLKPLKELNVIEIGGRYRGLSELLHPLCANYAVYPTTEEAEGTADLIYFGFMTLEADPLAALRKLRGHLNKGGLLLIGTRVSTGFDILTLRGEIDNIYPYEHTVLPSTDGLAIGLRKTGYELLELSTPGSLDLLHVSESRSKLDKRDLFTRYLLEKADENTRSEFQRFLQKNAISSYAQLVAAWNGEAHE